MLSPRAVEAFEESFPERMAEFELDTFPGSAAIANILGMMPGMVGMIMDCPEAVSG